MPSEPEIINPLHYPGWDELVLNTEKYSFFHSSAWARVLCESYNYTPTYFTIIDKTRLLLLIPLMEVKSLLTGKRGVSLPFSDTCEPIISQDIKFEEVLNHIFEYAKQSGWQYVEFRGNNGFSNSVASSSYFHEHTLKLSANENKMITAFRSSTKRNIQKAVAAGIEVKICNGPESINEYYHLHCITRKRHGVPPQPFGFFNNIFKNIIAKKSGIVILASYNKKNIAGALYFHFGDKALFKYGASDKDYQNLRPNNLVMWEAIKWYGKKRYKEFSFGRTEPDNEGLRQFKNGWATNEQMIRYYKFDISQNAFLNNDQTVSELNKLVFKTIPVCVSKAIGSVFYRHMG
jgi:hypothetical protein